MQMKVYRSRVIRHKRGNAQPDVSKTLQQLALLELIQCHHVHGNISILYHLGKLLKTDFSVEVEVSLHHGLVDNLLSNSN